MLSARIVAEQLDLGPQAYERLAQLEAVRLPPPYPFVLPIADAAQLLTQLHVPPEDIPPIIASMPAPETHPAEWWLLERCYAELISNIGSFDDKPVWPVLPAERGLLSRVLYLYVFLAATPIIRRWHEHLGIAEDISWATLADLGLWVRNYRIVHGQTGFDEYGWLTYHFRGGIYRLGRLQFGRWRISFDPTTTTLDTRFHRGAPALGVHIPGGSPLTPQACDVAFAQARPFYERHFPNEQYCIAECNSWLLDQQLCEYLPAHSNIIQFQQRFTIVADTRWPADDEIARFVFGRPLPAALESLPQSTMLQRAIVDHLRAGRHWYSQVGWMYLGR
jgi:hypothetical protein